MYTSTENTFQGYDVKIKLWREIYVAPITL